MKIAKNIVRARKRKKLSPSQFATLMGVSRSLVFYWEHGGPGPRYDRLPKIAAVLDTTVQELLGLEERAA